MCFVPLFVENFVILLVLRLWTTRNSRISLVFSVVCCIFVLWSWSYGPSCCKIQSLLSSGGASLLKFEVFCLAYVSKLICHIKPVMAHFGLDFSFVCLHVPWLPFLPCLTFKSFILSGGVFGHRVFFSFWTGFGVFASVSYTYCLYANFGTLVQGFDTFVRGVRGVRSLRRL